MFAKVDADGSGEIDYSEFVVATMNEKNLLSNNKLQTAFKMFDKDGGGSISTDEIKQVLSFGQNLDEKVVNDIIKQVDANGDGEISFEEFAEMMKKASWTRLWPDYIESINILNVLLFAMMVISLLITHLSVSS